MILFHGSDHIIPKPQFGIGKEYNDYGRAFYCTESLDMAKEWACAVRKDGFVNKYSINIQNLKILDLTDDKYTILHWLTLLAEHRIFSVKLPVVKRGINWLGENYHIDLADYDVIKGYRADDSYFSFARAFLQNQISLDQLERAMQLGNLGIQYALLSERAFEGFAFEGYEIAKAEIYYSKRLVRDAKAREEYLKIVDEQDALGTYLIDLMR